MNFSHPDHMLAEEAVVRQPPGHAALTNMASALRTLIDCVEADQDSPRLGLFYGFSGYGKTVATGYAAATFGAIYLQALPIWTTRSFLTVIGEELGLTRMARTAPELLQQIIRELQARPRPIVIDEMDYLVKDRFIEVIRAIHDSAPVAIVMVGEEALPAKLKEWERFDNRVLVATPAQPASQDDVFMLRDHFCTRVRVTDDLALYFGERCRGVTRRIVTNLKAAQREALAEGDEAIDRAWWGSRPVLTGDVPTRRSMGAQ